MTSRSTIEVGGRKRYARVQTIKCNECGGELELAAIHIDLNEHGGIQSRAGESITEVLSVTPCKVCIDRYTKPARMVMDGMRELMGNDEKEHL